jgi:hypothetical protein
VIRTKLQELKRKSGLSKVGLKRELLKIVCTKVPMEEGSCPLIPRSNINILEPLALGEKEVLKYISKNAYRL